MASEKCQVVHQPKAAEQKTGFTGREPIDIRNRVVPRHEPLMCQLSLDGFHGSAYPWIRGREEADERQHQEARVEQTGAIRLDKGALTRVEPLRTDFSMNGVADGAPVVERPVESELLDGL